MVRAGIIALAALLVGVPGFGQDSRSRPSEPNDPFGTPGEVVSKPSLQRPEWRRTSPAPDQGINPVRYQTVETIPFKPTPITNPKAPTDPTIAIPQVVPPAEPTPIPLNVTPGMSSPVAPVVQGAPGCSGPSTCGPRAASKSCLDRVSDWLFYRPSAMPCDCGSRPTAYRPPVHMWFANRPYDPALCGAPGPCKPTVVATPEPRPLVPPTATVIGQQGLPLDPVPLNGRTLQGQKNESTRRAPETTANRVPIPVGEVATSTNPPIPVARPKPALSPYAPNDVDRR